MGKGNVAPAPVPWRVRLAVGAIRRFAMLGLPMLGLPMLDLLGRWDYREIRAKVLQLDRFYLDVEERVTGICEQGDSNAMVCLK